VLAVVISGFGKVESGFAVALVTGKFLADLAAVTVFEFGASV
jgi:hypothetical protein